MNHTADGSSAGTAVAWWHWHRRLYDWVIHFAQTSHGATALFVLSFAESSCFPVPPDVLLAPLALGAPQASQGIGIAGDAGTDPARTHVAEILTRIDTDGIGTHGADVLEDTLA